MQKSNTALILKLAAIAAAVSVQGVALAQPASGPAAAKVEQTTSASPDVKRNKDAHRHHKHRRHMHGHGHHHHHRAAMLVPGYGPLGEKTVEALNLSDDQKKLLEEARDSQKAERTERFEAMKEKRKDRLETLKSGTLDPRAALKESEDARKSALERREQITGKWLAVWDSLDEAQQKQVAQHFAQRAEHRAERMQKHAERRAKQQSAE